MRVWGFSFCFLASTLLAAPAPLPKPPRPLQRKQLEGSWRMLWGTALYDATFHASGEYQASHNGEAVFVGSWNLFGNRLVIAETRVGDYEPGFSALTWVIPLDPRTLAGTIHRIASPQDVQKHLSPTTTTARLYRPLPGS